MKNKIITIVFLIIGFGGLIMQMYKYYYDELELTAPQFIVTSVFTIFVFRPRILIDTFKLIAEKIKK